MIDCQWSQQKNICKSHMGQDQVSGGVSVLCWHAAPVANVLWKPHTIRHIDHRTSLEKISNFP